MSKKVTKATRSTDSSSRGRTVPAPSDEPMVRSTTKLTAKTIIGPPPTEAKPIIYDRPTGQRPPIGHIRPPIGPVGEKSLRVKKDSLSQAGLRELVKAVTDASLSKAQAELPQVEQRSREMISEISSRVSSEEWPGRVDAHELELFTRGVVFGVARMVGDDLITRAVNDILDDPSVKDTLRQIVQIAESTPPLEAVADQVTNRIVSADNPNHSMFRMLVLFSAVVLAAGAGVLVPLLAGSATAEIILTNEVAIAAVVIGAATLKRN